MEEVRLNSAPKGLNVFSPSLGGEWLDNYQVRRALRLGLGDQAIQVCARILRETDRRLIWQHAETTILLAEAWLLKDELEAAAEKLQAVIPLLTSTGNGRDLAAVRRIVGRLRKRWPGATEVRQLDELLGYQRRG